MEEPKLQEPSTRERILDAALELFSTSGFHATTTRKISQLANINEVTLFRHFKRKIDLFAIIMDHIKEVGLDARRLETINLSPKKTIEYAVFEIVRILEEYPREFKLMFFAGLEKVEGFEATFVKQNLIVFVDYFEDIFKQLQKSGDISDREDPSILAGMLVTQIHGIATARIVSDLSPLKKISRQRICQSIVDHFLSR